MKTVTTTTCVCEVCGQGYDTPAEAMACESRPVTHNNGVKVGDTVFITSGDSAGCKARVDKVSVARPGWGSKAFDHSIVLSAEILEGSGKGCSRLLCFDSYGTI